MSAERVKVPTPLDMSTRLMVSALASVMASGAIVYLCVSSALPMRESELNGTFRLVLVCSVGVMSAVVISSLIMFPGWLAIHRRASGGRDPLLATHAQDGFSGPMRVAGLSTLILTMILALDVATLGGISRIQGPRRLAVDVLSLGVFQAGLIYAASAWRRSLWLWLSRLTPGDVDLDTPRTFAWRYALRVVSAFGVLACAAVAVPTAYLATAQEVMGGSSARLEAQGVALFYLTFVFGAALLVLTLATWFGYRLGMRIASDVRELIGYVGSIEGGRFEPAPAGIRTRAAQRLARGAEELSQKYREMTDTEARARRSIEDTQRLKTRFMAFMSHELRSPLNSIAGFADVLADEVDGPLNGEQRKSVAAIRDAGQVLLRLVTDIVDTARVEAGKLQLTRQPTRPEDLVQRAVARARGRTGDGLRFHVDIESGMPDVLVDPDRAEQALVGVLEHVGRMTNSGTIRIRAAAPDNQLRVDIDADELPSEDTQRIFVAFREIRRPSGRRVGGLGLGLALARTLAVAHGGDLFYESSGPTGARFTFALPIEEESVF